MPEVLNRAPTIVPRSDNEYYQIHYDNAIRWHPNGVVFFALGHPGRQNPPKLGRALIKRPAIPLKGEDKRWVFSATPDYSAMLRDQASKRSMPVSFHATGQKTAVYLRPRATSSRAS